jgi:hypothetical protein
MKKIFLILIIVIANSIVSFSQLVLTCAKDSGTNGVLMVWTGDVLPYDAIRGIAPDPFIGEYQTIADDVTGT